MGDSKLKMNDDNTELMVIGTRSKFSQIIPNLTLMTISGCGVPLSQSVGNLGFYLDETLFADVHIKYLCCILFCQFCRIGKIRFFLSTDAANKLAFSFILFSLDCCNYLLAGIHDNKLNKLQRIQNQATRLVLRKSRHACATILLRTLHWPPVKARIQYFFFFGGGGGVDCLSVFSLFSKIWEKTGGTGPVERRNHHQAAKKRP